MTLPKRWPLWLGMGALALLAWWRLRPAPMAVDTVVVTVGPLRETIDEEGETRVHDRYLIAAPVAGRLSRLQLRAGDPVRQGALIAWLEPAPLDTRLRQQAVALVEAAEDARATTDAEVLAATTALAQAIRARGRAESLATQGHLSAAGREDAEQLEATRRHELEAAQARGRSAVHEVERARAGLLAATERGGSQRTRTPIHAPANGRVLRVLEESERVVPAGTPLLEVGDPARLEIVADLLSTDAVRVRVGDTVLVEQWGGDGPLMARVRRVEPSGFTRVSALGVEEQRVNVVSELLDPAGPLGDRYRVEVRVVLWGAAQVRKVPLSALVRHNGEWIVYVVSGGRARARRITLGHRGGFEVEVPTGLEPGDVILRFPSDLVHEGGRVRAISRGSVQ